MWHPPLPPPGRSNGVFSLRFDGSEMTILPELSWICDATIQASLDNLLGMAQGTVSVDKLFMSGQLQIEGNMAKGVEIRNLLSPQKR